MTDDSADAAAREGEVAGPESQYTPAELEEIRRVVAVGEMPNCPRCGVKMTSRSIGGGSFGLGYARKRDWLICPKCKRSALYDIKRGTRN